MDTHSKWASLRQRLSTNSPALTVAVVALVVALGGGAFAATGAVTSKSKGKFVTKAEATKIAKKYAGKNGAAGANGTNGTNGAPGAPGKEGPQGKTGLSGANGKSVVVVGAASICPTGGVSYEVEESGEENEVCNGEKGEKGSPWTPGGTLPPASTSGCVDLTATPPREGCAETGTWTFTGTTADTQGIRVPLSFPIPLAAGLAATKVHWQEETNFADFDEAGSGTIGCTGTAAVPTAPSGNLCVYINTFDFPVTGKNTTFDGIYKVNASNKGTNAPGATLRFTAPTGDGAASGSFAVTG